MVYKAIDVLKRACRFRRAIVVAPLRPAYEVWPAEQRKWADFAGLKVQVLHGLTKRDDVLFGCDADVLVVNHEGLPWLLGADLGGTSGRRIMAGYDEKRLKRVGACTLVMDELTKFKHTNTARFKMLKGALPSFERRWGLTGSLGAEGLLDLFGQCYVLDLGAALGRYVTHYRTQFFVPNVYTHEWKAKEGAAEAIHARIAPLMIRLEAHDLPPVVEDVMTVELPPKARKIYRDLEAELIADVGRGVVTAANAAVASMKCRQVAAGGIYEDRFPPAGGITEEAARGDFGQKRKWVNLHDGKAQAVAELLEALAGEPLLVAYDFRHDLDRIAQAVGKSYLLDGELPYVGGGVSPKRAADLFARWNAGRLPLLLGHPQSIGHGVNLQGASARHVAWHTLPWPFELYDQFVRRIRRQGTKAESVFSHLIVAKDTIDEAQVWSLRARAKGQGTLYDALKKYARRRR